MSSTSRCKMVRILIAACFSALIPTGCVTLPEGRARVETPRGTVSVVFSDKDRQLIRDFYTPSGKAAPPGHGRGKKGKKLPPGLAKKDRLPPGLEKQLERNGKLPPGLQARLLPRELENSLSPLPNGFSRGKIGASVVLVNDKTKVVVDIILDVGN